jgi:hypothetical protein
MINIELKGFSELTQKLQALKDEKIPSAVRNAVNDTAWGLRAKLQEEMQRVFPTVHPSTLKNVFVLAADKKTRSYNRKGIYEAVVVFNQLYGSKGSVDEYMMKLIAGGGRSMKPSEDRLGRYWVPATKANPGLLNKWGNMPGGKVQQILSRMGLFNDGGYNSNATANSRKKWFGARKATEYVVIKRFTNVLQPGVYQRVVEQGRGLHGSVQRQIGAGAFQKGRQGGAPINNIVRARGLKPIMLFTRKPQYKPSFPFFGVGNDFVNRTLPVKIAEQIALYTQKGFAR